jgi:histidyl-tRNA synthetase
VDAEHIGMAARLWKQLGLADIRLQINTLGSPESRARHRARLVKYLEQQADALDADGKRRLHTNPLRVLDSKNPAMQALIEGAPRLYDDLDEDSLKHFEDLQAILRSLGLDYEINPRLVRPRLLQSHGLRMADRTACAQAAVCAGGRYDGLIAQRRQAGAGLWRYGCGAVAR